MPENCTTYRIETTGSAARARQTPFGLSAIVTEQSFGIGEMVCCVPVFFHINNLKTNFTGQREST
jgi:hypothetical protein